MNSEPNAKAFLSDYFSRLTKATVLTDLLVEDLAAVAAQLKKAALSGGKVLFIGNGGSASISAHLATDLTKNGGIRSLAFADDALLTCLANDYGYERVFQHAVRMYGDPGDVLVAISSSGSSMSIVNAAEEARSRRLSVVTLSGMDPDNPLRKMGESNLWVDSHAYNIIETVHQFWMMAVVDMIIGSPEYSSDRVVSIRSIDRTSAESKR